MALALFAGAGVALALSAATTLAVPAVLLRSGIMAVAAMVLEGISPRGLDNLTVPLGCGLFYSVLWA